MLGVVVQIVLFSQESWHDGVKLAPEAEDKAVAAITRELMPHRNVVIQIWNEFSQRVLDHVKTVRSVDPKRIVTNSPGVSGFLGDPPQNNALDYLTPHTSPAERGTHLGNRAERDRIPFDALQEAGGRRRAGAQRHAEFRGTEGGDVTL